MKATTPQYQRIKQHVMKLIRSGKWRHDRRLPSELELTRQFKVSRMTVNRALRELANDGYIERISGVGSFVVEPRAESHPLEIRNISEEIKSRGHHHSSEVLALKELRADDDLALQFDLAPGSRLYFSRILHLESEIPIQLESRFILPAFAPDYLETDFTRTTPSEYLLAIEPDIEQIEQTVTAAAPDDDQRKLLDMAAGEPCLVLTRRTWVDGAVVTFSRLYHPSSRFRFSSRYKPSGP